MAEKKLSEYAIWQKIMSNSKIIGIDLDKNVAYINDKTWGFSKNVATLNTVNKLNEILKEMQDGKESPEKILTMAKKTLSLTLEKFDFDALANDEKVGLKLVIDLCGLVRDYAINIGGQPGAQYLKDKDSETFGK